MTPLEEAEAAAPHNAYSSLLFAMVLIFMEDQKPRPTQDTFGGHMRTALTPEIELLQAGYAATEASQVEVLSYYTEQAKASLEPDRAAGVILKLKAAHHILTEKDASAA